MKALPPLELFSSNHFDIHPPPGAATPAWNQQSPLRLQSSHLNASMAQYEKPRQFLSVNQDVPSDQSISINPNLRTNHAMPGGFSTYQPPSLEQRLEAHLSILESRFEAERRRHEHIEWGLRRDISRLGAHIDSMGAKMLAHAQELEKKLEDTLSELARQSDKQEEAVDDKFELLKSKVDDLETQKFELLKSKVDDLETQKFELLRNKVDDLETKMAEKKSKKEMESETQAQTKLRQSILEQQNAVHTAEVPDAAEESTAMQPSFEDETAEPEDDIQWDEAGGEVELLLGDETIRVPIPSRPPSPELPPVEEPNPITDWPYPGRSTGKRAPSSLFPGRRHLNKHRKPPASGSGSRTIPSTKSNMLSSPSPRPRASPSQSSMSASSESARGSSLLVSKKDGSKGPIYFFRKHPDTVWEQWAEYAHGLGGQPAVRDLDDRYGVTWRKETYARTWYYRRKRFWTLILDLQKSGLSEEDALAEVERRRGDRTVAKLVDDLVKQATVPKREKSVDKSVRGPNLKRERTDLEEDEDLSEGVDDEMTAKRTTAMQLRKRTVHPPETISIWDCEDNEL